MFKKYSAQELSTMVKKDLVQYAVDALARIEELEAVVANKDNTISVLGIENHRLNSYGKHADEMDVLATELVRDFVGTCMGKVVEESMDQVVEMFKAKIAGIKVTATPVTTTGSNPSGNVSPRPTPPAVPAGAPKLNQPPTRKTTAVPAGLCPHCNAPSGRPHVKVWRTVGGVRKQVMCPNGTTTHLPKVVATTKCEECNAPAGAVHATRCSKRNVA